LPGVFLDNPEHAVNLQLWTIPYELKCYLALVILAVLALVKRPAVFAVLLIGLVIAQTIWVLLGHPVTGHMLGMVLVFSFLAGVAIYLNRDVVPYSHWLGFLSVIAAAVFLELPDYSYLAVFPVAYVTVWLGLMSPPAIPFGDLSYGVYLFHFPIEQAIVAASPRGLSWWLVALIALPLTAICAWLSWNLIEKPVLTHKRLVVGKVDQAWIALTGYFTSARWPGKAKAAPDPDAVPE
jgi:peptidoglycan/LPS O-acetylase OafA/YrhL